VAASASPSFSTPSFSADASDVVIALPPPMQYLRPAIKAFSASAQAAAADGRGVASRRLLKRLRVKGFVSSVVSFGFRGEYALRVTIGDGSAEVEALMAPALTTRLLGGVPAAEFAAAVAAAQRQDAAAHRRVQGYQSRMQRRLACLEGMMSVELEWASAGGGGGGTCAVCVTSIEEPVLADAQALLQRMQQRAQRRAATVDLVSEQSGAVRAVPVKAEAERNAHMRTAKRDEDVEDDDDDEFASCEDDEEFVSENVMLDD
jgi:hypothetical protein